MHPTGQPHVNSREPDYLGAFPVGGPITYLELSVADARAALGGPHWPITTWFHQTGRAEAASAAWQGLIPSCWVGGDGCCVFGDDSREKAFPFRGEWILEVRSRPLPEQQKAWWVPAEQIVGDWNEGVFYMPDELRAIGRPLLTSSGSCACELTDLIGRIRDRIGIIDGLALLSRGAAEQGDQELAGRLWGAIEAERAPVPEWQHEIEELAKLILARAGPRFQTGVEAGRELSLDDAVARRWDRFDA